jgi:putative glycosyltransferase (TIGR04372 family)
VPPGRPFVTLHVRERGFKQHDAGFGHRNAHLENYLPAIEALVRRGVVVIRLGSPHMRPAPVLDGLVDYANSEVCADWMDIFLCAEGLFHIGVESGISHVPVTFGKPTLFTNWMRLGSLPAFGSDLVMPRLLWSEVQGRVLSLREVLQAKLGHPQCSFLLAAHGVRPLESTAEDIRDAALELLDHVQGTPGAPAAEDEKMQEAIRSLLEEYGQVMNCRFPRSFVRHHFRALMPSGVKR